MSVINRSNQGGAAVSFVIIAIAVTVLVIAGIYFVRQRGETARRDAAIAAADTRDDTETPPTGSNKETPVEPVRSDDEFTNEPSDTVVKTDQPATELPTTGPADILMQVMIVAGLTYTIARFVQPMYRQRDIL